MPALQQSRTLGKATWASAIFVITTLLLAASACGSPINRVRGDPQVQSAIPPIDLAAPRQTKTAAFALG